MFPGVAKLGNICFGKQKCFWVQAKTFFVLRVAKFVSATHVSRAAKLGNICIRNNVSATMFPSLARPLHENHLCQTSKSALCLFRITCLTWNNRKKLNLRQSSIYNSLLQIKWTCLSELRPGLCCSPQCICSLFSLKSCLSECLHSTKYSLAKFS